MTEPARGQVHEPHLLRPHTGLAPTPKSPGARRCGTAGPCASSSSRWPRGRGRMRGELGLQRHPPSRCQGARRPVPAFPAGPEGGPHLVEGTGKGPRGCRRKSRGCRTNAPFLLSSPRDSSPPRQASLKDAALHAALAQSWAPGGRSPAPSNAALLLEPKSCAPMARFANAPAHTCVPVRARASTREHMRTHGTLVLPFTL